MPQSTAKSSETLQSRQLSPYIGAEVLGIDLSQPLNDEIAQAIRDLWEESSVLLFRNQTLTDDDHVRFVELFGTIQQPIFKTAEASVFAKHPSVVLISNVTLDGKLIGAVPNGELLFHSDYAYLEHTGKASCLYSIEVPSSGGDTRFASAYAACDALSSELRERLQSLTALNVYSTDGGHADDARRYVHPMITTHPGTGRKVLFVNRLMTTEIIGLPSEESDGILSQLFDIQEQQKFIYDHHWRPGDLIIWDNRSCLHARTDFDPAERRLLKRVTTQGEIPHT